MEHISDRLAPPSGGGLDHILRTPGQIREELGIAPVPVDIIRNPDIFERERREIFSKVWLKVATTWELPEPGDYKVKDIAAANASIIIVRDREGRIRAFHNVCTHRGNRIISTRAPESSGRARAHVLTCRFHGWVFSTDGSLRSVPAQEGFGALDRGCLGLREIACDTWEGFVFVSFAEPPEQSLADYLGDFGRLFAGFPYHEATTAYRYSTVLECNWKVALYAFSEGYHVPTIHAGSLPGFTGLDHCDFKLMGPHASSTIHGGGMEVAPSTRAFGALLAGSEDHRPRPDQLPAYINRDGREDFQFEFPNIFPNFLIHLSAGCGYPGMAYFTHQFWPLGHGETLWEGINYFWPARNAAEDVAQRHVSALHRNAWLEDTATMEDTFAGIMSGAIDEMHLMDQEFMIRHAALQVRERIGG